jgi:hypothetical protein
LAFGLAFGLAFAEGEGACFGLPFAEAIAPRQPQNDAPAPERVMQSEKITLYFRTKKSRDRPGTRLVPQCGPVGNGRRRNDAGAPVA